MSTESATLRFALLSALVDCTREQWVALQQDDLTRFSEITRKRAEIIDELLSANEIDSAPPPNVVQLPTALNLQDRADDVRALDLTIRTILEQDQRNDRLLELKLELTGPAS
jgi:hypothetical protein